LEIPKFGIIVHFQILIGEVYNIGKLEIWNNLSFGDINS